jgi:NADH-quinone oxidoreductase subunit M
MRCGCIAGWCSGRWRSPELADILDLNLREKVIFVPLVVLTILLGVWPSPVLETSANSVAALVEHTRSALAPAASSLVQLR